MLNITEAKAIVERYRPAPRAELLALGEAAGLVAAEDIRAGENLPRFTNSAMDGYALRWADIEQVREGTAAEVRLVGESRAGAPYGGRVEAATAVRISTGAMLPEGADTVIPQEDVHAGASLIRILRVRSAGANIRHCAEEIQSGATVLPAGGRIGAAQIALLASLGIRRVAVYAAPRVAVILTGSELLPWDSPAPPPPGKIRDSNGPMLAALIRESGGSVQALHRADDNPAALRTALESALAEADIIVCSGGVSVGPHDIVRSVAAQAGCVERFWRVRQKPGKPLYFATYREKPIFGLPGNPVSAYMCFHYYIRPVIRHARGAQHATHSVRATLAESLQNKHERAEMLRVALRASAGGTTAHPLRKQGSHMLSSLTEADGFIILDARQELAAGMAVPVYMLHQYGEF